MVKTHKGNPGERLTPTLIRAISQAIISTKHGLADHEFKLNTMIHQEMANRQGHEVADLYRPFWDQLLTHEGIDPGTRHYIEQVRSGDEQWKALSGNVAGMMAGTAVSSSMGSLLAPLAVLINNGLAGAVRSQLNGHANMLPDPATVAQLYAMGWIPWNDAIYGIQGQGIESTYAAAMLNASLTYLDVNSAGEALRRGIIDRGAYSILLHNLGITGSIETLYHDLTSSILTVQDAAISVLRGDMPYGEGQNIAHQNGFSDSQFTVMLDNMTETPGLDSLMTARRRGLIDENQFNTGMSQLHIHAGWQPVVRDLLTNILTPADAALAVLRGDLTEKQGRDIANANGYTDDSFSTLLLNTGEPPGAQELMEALRRDFIDESTFKKGILQSRIRDEWEPTMLKLRYSPMATADAVRAYVEGYYTKDQAASVAQQNGLDPEFLDVLLEAYGDPLSPTDMMDLWRYGRATEDDVKAALKRGRLKDDYIPFFLKLKTRPMSTPDAIESYVQGYLTDNQAKAIAAQNGLDPDSFDILKLTAGEPLAKMEMLTLLRRGKVTEAQVKAALRQSRMKDEYIDDALQLRYVYPGLFEVRTLLVDGDLTPKQATEALLYDGYTPEFVKAIVKAASAQSVGAGKQLTLAFYSDLYLEGMISETDFTEELKDMGYVNEQATLILAFLNNKLLLSSRSTAVSRVRSNYLGHKITNQQAKDELNKLEITANTVERLLDEWGIVLVVEQKKLTAAEVLDYWQLNGFSDNQVDNTQAALEYLYSLGYSADDAIALITIKNKGPLDTETSGKLTVPPTAAKSSTAKA